jgi:antitoxin (DNA-binding transcriptional repressor) of toxin-antitoxin stability system
MQQIIVTVEQAREHLSELIARVSAGDSVMIAEGGKSVAYLSKPPIPATPEEIAESRKRASEAVKTMAVNWLKSGVEVPGEERLRAFLDETC